MTTDHERRVFHHMYETCETPAEHAERITCLEELVADMYDRWSERDGMWEDDAKEFRNRASALGIEVD